MTIRIITLGACAVSGLFSTSALAAAPDPATLADIPGLYECHTGSSSIVSMGAEPKIQTYDRSNPMLRVEVLAAKVGEPIMTHWWIRKGQEWRDTLDDLKIKDVAAQFGFWAVSFEGSGGGDRLPATISGTLSYFAKGIPFFKIPNQPTLQLTSIEYGFGSSAASVLCDKVERPKGAGQ